MFISKKEIELKKPSLKYLDLNEMCGYKEVKKAIHKVDRRCVIHITPVSDTYSSDDENDLNGYADSLFFKVDVYDVKNRTVYKHSGYVDAVDFRGVDVESRIYKDLSTMFIVDESVKICYSNIIEVKK